MAKIINTLSRIFNRRPSGDLKYVTESIDNSLNKFAYDLDALRQIEFNIRTATGEWLDEWGSWFGVPRIIGEPDSEYGSRIISTAIRPRTTIPSIKSAILDMLGDPNAKVDIYEPYTNIFKFNKSLLDGEDKITDAIYQRHAVIDIIIYAPLPPNLLDSVKEIKAGGIKVYLTHVNEFGEGALLRAYSDEPPRYGNLVHTELKEKLTDLFILNGSILGDSSGLISGRKLTFNDRLQEYDFGKIRAGRTSAFSRNTHIYDWVTPPPISDMDDYFNAVSYEREKELGKVVVIDEIPVTRDTDKTTQLLVMLTPDLYANSMIPMNIFLDQTVKSLYVHPSEYHVESQLKGRVPSVFTGSLIPISMLMDRSIEEIDGNLPFEDIAYISGVESVTLPA